MYLRAFDEHVFVIKSVKFGLKKLKLRFHQEQ